MYSIAPLSAITATRDDTLSAAGLLIIYRLPELRTIEFFPFMFFSGPGSESGSIFAVRTEHSIVLVTLDSDTDSDPDPDEADHLGCRLASEFIGAKGLSP